MEKLEQRRYNISRVLQRGYGLGEAGFSFFYAKPAKKKSIINFGMK